MKNRIKLESRKLSSGNYQVKFFVKDQEDDQRYGYILVKPTMTLKEVVLKINDSLIRKRDFGYLNLMKTNQGKEILLFNL